MAFGQGDQARWYSMWMKHFAHNKWLFAGWVFTVPVQAAAIAMRLRGPEPRLTGLPIVASRGLLNEQGQWVV